MPTNRRRARRTAEASLRDQGFIYFGPGNFFDEAVDFAALPEAERLAFWRANRAAIIEDFHAKNPQLAHLKTWGETLEELEKEEAECHLATPALPSPMRCGEIEEG